MAAFPHFFPLLYILSLVIPCSSAPHQIPKPYIIYMGSSTAGNANNVEVGESTHLQLLSSIIPSEQKERLSLLHSYSHAFKGFSAMLTENEAAILSGKDEILSVFPDPILQVHTTRSWDFLEEESGIKAGLYLHHHNMSNDIIIGVIDTGIWPESPSFKDDGIGEIPSRWKGVCMEGHDFKKSNCNRKLIGARYYHSQFISKQSNKTKPTKLYDSPRDTVGHGTHTASIAAGSPVANASYYGLAKGSARGGLPSARIASYKACTEEGCNGATILKAIDDAIMDGVDMISLSIGMNLVFQSDFLSDPIAIGAFHAEQMGVIVVCSAGNDGPDPYTVVNTAPWIFTVGASNIDRNFQSTLLLGNKKTFQGSAINFSMLNRSRTYPLAFGEQVAANFTPASDARNCIPGSLDSMKASGNIIVCINTNPTIPRRIKKLVVENAQAKGMVLVDEALKDLPFDSGTFPFTGVGDTAGSQILNYINSTKSPSASILPSVTLSRVKPAPTVASFSSRGPGGLTENILKPDIMAPGVAVLAAMIPQTEEGSVPIGRKPSLFGIQSGTSMACPHVTGAAAFIKSVHKTWTTSMIKSALMTTAILFNNMRNPLTDSTNDFANPHEMGVGEISPLRALDPGLVFETTIDDYLNFLCHNGYPENKIRSMSKTKFNCPKNSVEDLISNINYPSISIGKLNRHQGGKVVKRILSNVGTPNASYVSSVHAPLGLIVNISPKKIAFSNGLTRASFEAFFNGKAALKGYNYGVITWFDGHHKVHVVFAVNVE